MKLLIYDKFWDSFMQLNKGTQKKVTEFMDKFRENSKSSAINLESINTFKDPSLKTARIDQKYRAIIKAPDKGDTFFLLWVDNHDEAMDWACSKIFHWNETTQAVQVFSAMESVEIPIPPQMQQGLLEKHGKNKLINLGVPEILLPSVLQINDLNDLEKMQSYLPTDVFENLFYLLDGADIDQLIYEINEGKISAGNHEDQLRSINNQRSFMEWTDNNLLNEILEGNLDKWKYYLHPTQRKLVEDSYPGTIKVSGGAGTGKTVAALHRFKKLVENNTNPSPVLFTTFTKALTQNLKHLAGEWLSTQRNYRIDNIDYLAFELAKSYKLIDEQSKVFGLSAVKSPAELWQEVMDNELAGYDIDFLMDEFEQVILFNGITDFNGYKSVSRMGRGRAISIKKRLEIWNLIEKYQAKKSNYSLFHKEEVYNLVTIHHHCNLLYPFAHIVADELQDFSNVELRFIRSLTEVKPNDLFLVGDPLQSIYNKKINFTKAGIEIRGRRNRRLRINYRTTEEIKKLAVSVIEDCHYDDFDGQEEEKKGYVSLFHGPKPHYQLFQQKQEETAFVLKTIKKLVEESGCHFSNIAISARSREGIKEFAQALHKDDLPYYETHSGKSIGDKSGIRILTFHSIKGLEFKHVFLVDVNHRTCPKLHADFAQMDESEKEQHLKSEKSLVYVAISRAIEKLTITGTGIKSTLIKI
jgi:hypothetical protein